MYFNDFENITATGNQRSFIKELSEMIEHFTFAMIDTDKVKITNATDHNGEYLKLSLPHKTDKEFDLWIALYDTEAIVFFGGAHQHFEEADRQMAEAVGFITEILQGKLEIHTFYKGNRRTKVKMYFVNENNERELISSCSYLNFAWFRSFSLQKVRKEIKRISFIG